MCDVRNSRCSLHRRRWQCRLRVFAFAIPQPLVQLGAVDCESLRQRRNEMDVPVCILLVQIFELVRLLVSHSIPANFACFVFGRVCDNLHSLLLELVCVVDKVRQT